MSAFMAFGAVRSSSDDKVGKPCLRSFTSVLAIRQVGWRTSCARWLNTRLKGGRQNFSHPIPLVHRGRNGRLTGAPEQHCRVYFVTRKNAQTSSTFILQQIGRGEENVVSPRWPTRLEFRTLFTFTQGNLILGWGLQIHVVAKRCVLI